jgi:hypothetical protein
MSGGKKKRRRKPVEYEHWPVLFIPFGNDPPRFQTFPTNERDLSMRTAALSSPPVLSAAWWRSLVPGYNGNIGAFQLRPKYSSYSLFLHIKPTSRNIGSVCKRECIIHPLTVLILKPANEETGHRLRFRPLEDKQSGPS